MSGFVVADYCVFGVTIIISLGIGIYYALSGGRQKTTSEYLVGNRQMKILPVALSLMVSFESSIMMLGFPAETYVYGMSFWLSTFAFLVALLLAVRMVVPLVHPLKLTSVYEILYMAIVLFGPGIALEAVTDFPMWASVLVVAAASIVYTSIGTMVAGGVSNVFEMNEKSGRLDIFNFDPDPTVRHTFWSLVIGSCIRMIGLNFNQSTIQRISATPRQRDANNTMSSGLSSLSALTVQDLVIPHVKQISETRATLIAKVSVVVYGLISMAASFLIAQIKGPMSQITSSVLSAFGGPMTGIFLLGIFCPWSEAKGTFVGGVTGVLFTFWLSIGSNFSKSLKKTPWLPLAPTDMCFAPSNDSLLLTTMNSSYFYTSPLSTNPTSTIMEDIVNSEPEGLDKFYSLSYQWFGVVGILVTMVVGTAISLLVAKYNPEEADVRFMLPFFDQFFPFLPKKLRKKLYFGVDFTKVYCHAIKAQLVSIETQSEGMFVRGLLQNHGSGYDPNEFWLGATDIINEGEWTWTKSATLVKAGNFTDWSPGQPDNGGSNDDDEHCMCVKGDYHYHWNDDNCEHLKHFICEKRWL
ncbi:hypothetical protein FSP39_010525 [Pinctada imbricata]|uniref:C-type lectin domain-containing protein n=1 Tax=Pinctada imbricata TaxID=66713 RepID=A0AA89C141_PINIB|nr:hypothetical protein FSP39_010525 [Pinctada imbricata]